MDSDAEIFETDSSGVTEMKKECSICSESFNITVNDDRSYSGGHYFGKVTGIEYWECDACYNKKDRND